MLSGKTSIASLFLCASIVAACHDDGLGVPAGQLDGGSADSATSLPPPCSTITDQQACAAQPDCEVDGCPDCEAHIAFQACVVKGQRHISCPKIACSTDCSAHTDEQSCSADDHCYAVYDDPGTCDCAFRGCCMVFTRCEEGTAQCSPAATQPACPDPQIPWDCGPNYAPVFSGACQIGCVKLDICPDDCRSTGCPGSQSCEFCWDSYQCLPDGSVC